MSHGLNLGPPGGSTIDWYERNALTRSSRRRGSRAVATRPIARCEHSFSDAAAQTTCAAGYQPDSSRLLKNGCNLKRKYVLYATLWAGGIPTSPLTTGFGWFFMLLTEHGTGQFHPTTTVAKEVKATLRWLNVQRTVEYLPCAKMHSLASSYGMIAIT